MTPGAIDRAARLLLEARRGRARLPAIPEDCRPETVEEAYAVQDRLVALMGDGIAGWFLGCTNVEIQRQLGLDGPYFGRLLASALHESPASLAWTAIPDAVLEVEFAFRLAHDLPARAEPYDRDEVAAAVASVHPAIEVVVSQLDDWTGQPIASLIADNGTDGALVIGAGVSDWRGHDLRSIEARLTIDGAGKRRGTGANALGDPLAALAWLANARRARGDGLEAGQVCNTGTLTSMYFAGPGDQARADFGPLGAVELTITR